MKKHIRKTVRIVGIILLVLMIVYNFTNINSNQQYIRVFGYKIIVVEEYQEQIGIENNDIVIGKETDNGYIVGDLVIVRINGSIYFHRIVDIKADNQYETKGDGNYKPNKELVSNEQIEGKVIKHISNLGLVLKLIKSKFFSVIILIGSIMLLIYNAHIYQRKIKRRFKQKSKRSEF